mmetsp:Transcript_17006/g.35484  ORF Transcript_17006/g.35484 Transcript_17006/m.35484 type:complete len:105 (+) Transcript_17006:544-858(+)
MIFTPPTNHPIIEEIHPNQTQRLTMPPRVPKHKPLCIQRSLTFLTPHETVYCTDNANNVQDVRDRPRVRKHGDHFDEFERHAGRSEETVEDVPDGYVGHVYVVG